MATATKRSLKKCIGAVSNFIALIPCDSFRLKTVSKFRKRKLKSLYFVFALHKRALLCRSRPGTAKKCTIKGCLWLTRGLSIVLETKADNQLEISRLPVLFKSVKTWVILCKMSFTKLGHCLPVYVGHILL